MYLAVLRIKWIAGLLTAAGLIAIACGGSATATPPPTATSTPAPTATTATTPTMTSEPTADITLEESELTAVEAEYIEQVRAGWSEFHSKAMEFRSVISQTYTNKARLLQALLEAGAGTAFESAYRGVEPLIAPERFKADQALMVQTLAEMVKLDVGIKTAAENVDLAEFAIADARLGEAALLMAIQLTVVVCRATLPPDAPTTLCPSGEPIPGGEYGARMNTALARFSAGFFPRLVGGIPHFETSDTIAAEAVLLPERIELETNLILELREFQPPADLTADHEIVVQFFESLLELTEARGAALQIEDMDTYEIKGREAEELQCGVGRSVSPDMLLIAPNFVPGPDCGVSSNSSSGNIDSIEVDPAELSSYMEAIAPAFETARVGWQALSEGLTAPGPDSAVDDVLAWFQGATDIQRQLQDSLTVVEPPAGIESLHNGLLEAASDLLTLNSRVVDLLEAAGPDFSIANDLAAHPELGIEPLNRVSQAVVAACEDIEQLAAANGIAADFSCAT